MNALAEMILAARARNRIQPAVADTEHALSDEELIRHAREEAIRIRRVAARPSPLIAVCLPLSTASVRSLLAAILGDYSICFVDPAAKESRREAVLAAVAPDVVVDAQGCRVPAELPSDFAVIDSPGYVAMSSGSTGGAPKGVLSPWSAIAEFAHGGAAALELDADSRWAEVSNPAYDMAMTNLLLALASGASIALSAKLVDQLRPLRFINRMTATHVRLAPRFIELAAVERRPSGMLPLRVWGSGGDRLYATQVAQAFAFGAPTVINTYGMSETIGFASAARLTANAIVPSLHGSVAIGRGAVGEWSTDVVGDAPHQMLRISSAYLPHGYYFGQSDGYPRWDGTDAVLTGDIGVRINENLYCLGRAGRRVKRNGTFVDLDEVDSALRRSRSLASFTTSTLSGMVLTIVEGHNEAVDGLRQELSSLLRPDVLPDDLIAVRRLPRLPNGKIDHIKAATLAESAIDGRSTTR